ncbi:late sexual development protein [Trichoderma chlorosporum]
MAQLCQLEVTAGGIVNLTNNVPSKLSPKGITQFQLIVVNQFFETSFFSSLLYNVTNDIAGYEYQKKDELVAILQTTLAQEELYVINAIKYLKYNDAFIPSPCRYEFGSTTLQHAINFAQVFTTITMGTLQETAVTMARDGNLSQVRTITAMITSNAEQVGYLRHMLEKKPSAQPFPTTSVAPFLLSALNTFTVPGSCPFPASSINITTFRPFNLVGIGMIKQKDQTLTFETDLNGVTGATKYLNKTDGSGLYVTYVTAQLKPISMPAMHLKWNKTVVTMDAYFPYSEYLMNGLSLAALTTKDDFSSVGEMLQFTLAAPAVMQADTYLNANNSLGALE